MIGLSAFAQKRFVAPRLLLAASIFMVGGCAQGSNSSAASAAHSADVTATADAATCMRAGGVMKPLGRRQMLQCVIPYADAGKSCTSGDQCAGDCRASGEVEVVVGQAVAGSCQATSERFGCFTTVEGGRAQSTICID